MAKENQEKTSSLSVGTVVEGTVESIQPYGAFVTLENGISGLIHISQISEKRIKSPSAVLSIGQTIKAKIISINNGKIGLSIKALNDVAEVSKEEPNYKLPSEEIGTGLGALLKNIKL